MAQEVQLVLVQAAFEAEQQPVVAHAGGVDRVLVDEHRVDHTAHFDEVLPFTAVARKARDLASGHRAHVAQADIGHHAFEAAARDQAGG